MTELRMEPTFTDQTPRPSPFLNENRRKGLRTLDLLMIRHEKARTQPTIENQNYQKPLEI